MSQITIKKATHLRGSPMIPGDKSVSHRGLLFGALSDGITTISNLLESEDVQSTARCLTQMGIKIEKLNNQTLVYGAGQFGLKSPTSILDCGNSGTTMRLLMGIISSQPGLTAELTGDHSLIKRPMKRVADPLRKMGADIELTQQDYAPLKITGRQLTGIHYELKIASAQIKTAIILAALFANGTTKISGEIHSRDHTERLLSHFGVQINSNSTNIEIQGGQTFKSNSLRVPSDPSTAAFWLAGACLVPHSEIELKNISLNPTRIGFIKALEKMGAQFDLKVTEEHPEPVGNIRIRPGKLKGIEVSEEMIPSLIDELPMLAVLATQAEGTTIVRGAEELRVKETDRIEAVAKNLRAMGAQIETKPDGFIIHGPQKIRGSKINSFHDHRIAMAFSIAGLITDEPQVIEHPECVSISYPNFYKTLEELTA